MPFDYNAFQTKCDGLTVEELQKEWENYTRQLAGGATSTAGAILFSPLTAGVSLVGLGLSTPRIHNARKKRDIIEASLRSRGATHQTRKRDVVAPMAISGGLGVLTLGLAGPGADLIAGEAVGKGVEYAAAHVALDGAAATAEHVHTKHEKKEAMEKLRREQQMRMGVPMVQPYQQNYMQQQHMQHRPMQRQMYQYPVAPQQQQFQQYIQQLPQLNAYPHLQQQPPQYQEYRPPMPERPQTEQNGYVAPVVQYPPQLQPSYAPEKHTYMPQPPQAELPQYQPGQQVAAPQMPAYTPAAHQQQYQPPTEQASRRYSYQGEPPVYQQLAQNPLAAVHQALRPVSMALPTQPSAPAPIIDQKSAQFEVQQSIAPQFTDTAAQPSQQSPLSLGSSTRDGEAFCQVQQQHEPAAPHLSQHERQEGSLKENQQYQQAWPGQSQKQTQQAHETEQDELERQLKRLELDQQLQHEKQQKPQLERKQEQQPEEQLQEQKRQQSEQEQQLQQIQQLQQTIREQQAIIQQQQEQTQQHQRRQSYLSQLPASAQTYPEPSPPHNPMSAGLSTGQYTQQLPPPQQPQQQIQQPQQNQQYFYQPQPQPYHLQLPSTPLSFNTTQTQPTYQPPHHLRHPSSASTLSTRPASAASTLPPYLTPGTTPSSTPTPYFPPPPKYAASPASSTVKPYAPADYFGQGTHTPQPQGGWGWAAPPQQVGRGRGAEPDYGAPPPPPAPWRG